jgi:predicted kinase
MEAVIFVGIPGSGKTTFFRERFFDSYMRISKDLLRTRHREQVFLRACLSTQQRFVVDNTNVLAAERRLYIPLSRAAKFRVIGYVFETSLEDAFRRNAQRQGKEIVPAAGVIAKYKRFQMPDLGEGFDELFSVSIHSESRFVVLPWSQRRSLTSAELNRFA